MSIVFLIKPRKNLLWLRIFSYFSMGNGCLFLAHFFSGESDALIYGVTLVGLSLLSGLVHSELSDIRKKLEERK